MLVMVTFWCLIWLVMFDKNVNVCNCIFVKVCFVVYVCKPHLKVWSVSIISNISNHCKKCLKLSNIFAFPMFEKYHTFISFQCLIFSNIFDIKCLKLPNIYTFYEVWNFFIFKMFEIIKHLQYYVKLQINKHF